MIGQYSQYLKFIDMRFSNRGGMPFPLDCEFAIGGATGWIDSYDYYTYVNVSHATQSDLRYYNGHSYPTSTGGMSEYFAQYFTANEITDIFVKYYGDAYLGGLPAHSSQRITFELLQYEAIKKIHTDMVMHPFSYEGYHLDPNFYNPLDTSNPSIPDHNPSVSWGNLFPHGKKLTYGLDIYWTPQDRVLRGIECQVVGEKKVDSNGYYIDTNSVKDYQRGLTIFRPASGYRGTASFNFNSPAVREYWVNTIVAAVDKNDDSNRIYVDNVSMDYGVVNYRGVEHEYMYPRDWSLPNYLQRAEIAKHYARLYASVLKEAQKRYYNSYGRYMDMLTNGWYFDDPTQYRNYFLEELQNYAGDSLNGGSCETYIACQRIENHINRIANFEEKNRKMIYLYNLGQLGKSSQAVYEDKEVYRMFLFFHLVAQDNTYFYVGPNYESSSFNSLIFDYPLGNPIDEVAYYDEEKKVWKRMYEKATVVFKPGEDVINSVLNSEHIWLEENIDLEKVIFNIEQIIEEIRMAGI